MNILIDRVGAGLKNQDPRLLGTTLPMFRDAYPDIIYRQDHRSGRNSNEAEIMTFLQP